jgi:hypothetical protein
VRYTCGMPQPRLTLTGTNIDAPDANALADFYRRLDPAGHPFCLYLG